MPRHITRQGEDLPSIAAKYGFADWESIYGHPQNAALRQKRPDPHILFPGDEVFVPERKSKAVTMRTGGTAQLEVKSLRRVFRIRIYNEARRPLGNAQYTIECASTMRFGTTDGNGLLREELPASAKTATVFIDGRTWTVRLGELNPIDKAPDGGVSGVQRRLANLGYKPGPVDGVLGSLTRRALVAFARDHELEPTGDIDQKLAKKLVEVHGS